MTRGIGLLAALCLIAAACSGNPTPPVLVEFVPRLAGPIQDEFPDAMIPIVESPDALVETVPTPRAPAAPATSGNASSAVTISQAATPPPAEPTQAPPPPKPTAAPKTPTPVVTPSAPASCPSAQQLSEGDILVRAAQQLPSLFYGGGLCSGDKVEASIGGSVCGSTTVNATGQWSITIRPTAPCAPTENASVTLAVNGKASGSATWKGGGLPPDVTNGYSLSR